MNAFKINPTVNGVGNAPRSKLCSSQRLCRFVTTLQSVLPVPVFDELGGAGCLGTANLQVQKRSKVYCPVAVLTGGVTPSCARGWGWPGHPLGGPDVLVPVQEAWELPGI